MELGLLASNAEPRLIDSGYTAIRSPEHLHAAVRPFERKLDLYVLTEVVDETMRRFAQRDGDRVARTESDQWLAPRLHASLRLKRSEAAIDEVWFFLAAYAFPDYVRWRWPVGNPQSRFFGTDIKKQAFKRLWWTAELFRNGSSYDSAQKALAKADIPNTFTTLRVIHSRPVALAVLEYVDAHDVTSRQTNFLATQLNTSAVTVALDRAYVSQDEATELDEAWLYSEPDLQEVFAHPSGPLQGEVSSHAVSAVRAALERIVDLHRLREYRKGEQHSEAQEGALALT